METPEKTAEELDEVDGILAMFEDWMHGEDGKNCTYARGLIQSIKKKLEEQGKREWISVEDKEPPIRTKIVFRDCTMKYPDR